MRFLYFVALISFFTVKSRSATCTASASSNWTLASTWSCGSVPSCNDIIIIPSGYTVTINTTVDLTGGGCTGTKINIYGTLFFSGNASRLDVVATSTINIYSGGKLTTDQPGNNSQKINIGNGSSEWSSNNGNLTGPWTITNGSSGGNPSLPIELMYFNAVCDVNGVQLDWATASERINDYFLVEKSLDALTWLYVTKIQGSGTTNMTHSYMYKDTELSNSVQYYQLSQIDKNGTKTIYKPVDVNCIKKTTDPMVLFPNPASTLLHVTLKMDPAYQKTSIKIVNLLGEIVSKNTVDIAQYETIDIPLNLNSGLYVVYLVSDENILHMQKINVLK
ncbi:MAG: T9SS type A sorting domain-containing protein [Bacteroidota bacterium]